MRLEKANIQHLAIVDRPCSRHNFIVKNASGLPVVYFMPFEVVKSAEGTLSGLAYCRPDEVDPTGDYATAEDLRHMAETFRANGHVMNLMHKADLAPEQAHVVKSEILRDGSWRVVAKVDDPDILRDCRKGVYRGFSVGGTCPAKSETSREDLLAEEAELLRFARDNGLVDIERQILENRRKREKAECFAAAMRVIEESRPGSPRGEDPRNVFHHLRS